MVARYGWRLGLLLLLPTVLLAAGCGGGSSAPAPKDGHYRNDRVRYRFDYPASWRDASQAVTIQISEGKLDLVDKVAVGNLEENTGILNGVMVIVVRIDHEVTPDGLEKELSDVDGLYKQFAANVAGALTTREGAELGGLSARQYVVQFAYLGMVEVASAHVVTFFGDRQYTVNCQGRASRFDSDVLPGCEKILESFRFK